MKIQPRAASQATNMAATGKTPNAGAAFQDALTASKKATKPASRSLAATNLRGPSRRSLPASVVGEEELSANGSQASLLAANMLGADAGMGVGAGGMGAYQVMMQRAALRNEMHTMTQQFLAQVRDNSVSVTKKSIEGMHV
jgi:hypothetical protein